MQAHEVMAGPSDCYCNNPPPVQHGTVASTMQSEAFPQNPAPSCRGQVAVSPCQAARPISGNSKICSGMMEMTDGD